MKVNLKAHFKRVGREIKKNRSLYLILIPSVLFVFVFSYMPLFGLYLAFVDYDPFLGFQSPWVGFANFVEIFSSAETLRVIGNTLYISLLNLVIGFVVPLAFALLLNELHLPIFKKFVQTVSYLPYFLSWIIVVSLTSQIFSITGPVNLFLNKIGINSVNFLGDQQYFVFNVIMLGVWKSFGYNAILYLSAMSGVDPNLYEAATIDGASKFRQVFVVTLPGIRSTIVVILVIAVSYLFSSNFELIYGLQNVHIQFEVISTWIYKRGIEYGEYSLSTALGLAQSVISALLLFICNKVSKKLTGEGIV